MIELNQLLGGDGHLLTPKELRAVMTSWRETFGTALHEQTGSWTIGDIEWHTFSHGYFPYISGDDAEESFLDRINEEFVVFSSGVLYRNSVLQLPASDRIVVSGDIPEFLKDNSGYFDLYFYSTADLWTMVYTHEPRFDRLYAQNGE